MGFRTTSELKGLSGPGSIIKGILPENALVVIYGIEGSLKSFLSLDMQLHIQNEKETWHGYDISEAGSCVYVMGEGSGGISKRVIAWEEYYSGTANLPVYDEPVNLWASVKFESQKADAMRREQFVQDAAVHHPNVLTFDTLAMCMVGGRENDAADMGKVIENSKDIQQRLDTTVVLVHHTPISDRNRPRGSSALAGAVDMSMRVEYDGTYVYASCSKMKDDEKFSTLIFKPINVVDSTVLVPISISRTPAELGSKAREVLAYIESHKYQVTLDEVEKNTLMSRASVYRAKDELVHVGLVEKDGSRYGIKGRHYEAGDILG